MSVYPAPIDFDPATHPILSRHWFGAKRSIQAVNDQKFNTCAGIDPEAIAAAGGGRVPPTPLHEVPR